MDSNCIRNSARSEQHEHFKFFKSYNSICKIMVSLCVPRKDTARYIEKKFSRTYIKLFFWRFAPRNFYLDQVNLQENQRSQAFSTKKNHQNQGLSQKSSHSKFCFYSQSKKQVDQCGHEVIKKGIVIYSELDPMQIRIDRKQLPYKSETFEKCLMTRHVTTHFIIIFLNN